MLTITANDTMATVETARQAREVAALLLSAYMPTNYTHAAAKALVSTAERTGKHTIFVGDSRNVPVTVEIV